MEKQNLSEFARIIEKLQSTVYVRNERVKSHNHVTYRSSRYINVVTTSFVIGLATLRLTPLVVDIGVTTTTILLLLLSFNLEKIIKYYIPLE